MRHALPLYNQTTKSTLDELEFVTRIGVSHVSNSDLRTAKSLALEALNDASRVSAFLADWPPMQRFERKQAAQGLNWAQLKSVNTTEIDCESGEALVCTITKDTAEEPVLVRRRTYDDLSMFLQWWISNGTDPIEREQPIELADVRKVVDIV